MKGDYRTKKQQISQKSKEMSPKLQNIYRNEFSLSEQKLKHELVLQQNKTNFTTTTKKTRKRENINRA